MPDSEIGKGITPPPSEDDADLRLGLELLRQLKASKGENLSPEQEARLQQLEKTVNLSPEQEADLALSIAGIKTKKNIEQARKGQEVEPVDTRNFSPGDAEDFQAVTEALAAKAQANRPPENQEGKLGETTESSKRDEVPKVPQGEVTETSKELPTPTIPENKPSRRKKKGVEAKVPEARELNPEELKTLVGHFLADLTSIENKLNQASTEDEIKAEENRLKRWDILFREKFPDPTRYEEVFNLAAKRGETDFEKIADTAREVIKLSTSSNPVPEEGKPTEGKGNPGREKKEGNLGPEGEPPAPLQEMPKKRIRERKPTEYPEEIQHLIDEIYEGVNNLPIQDEEKSSWGKKLRAAGGNKKRLNNLLEKIRKAKAPREPGLEEEVPGFKGEVEAKLPSEQPLPEQVPETKEPEVVKEVPAPPVVEEVVVEAPAEKKLEEPKEEGAVAPVRKAKKPKGEIIKAHKIEPPVNDTKGFVKGVEEALERVKVGKPSKPAPEQLARLPRKESQPQVDKKEADRNWEIIEEALNKPWNRNAEPEVLKAFTALDQVFPKPKEGEEPSFNRGKLKAYRDQYEDQKVKALQGRERRKEEEKEKRHEKLYQFFEQQYLRGMDLEDMKRRLASGRALPGYAPKELRRASPAEWSSIYNQFRDDVAKGYDPLARLAGEMTIHFVDDYQKLNAKDKEEAEKKFIEVTREVWQNFVYGAKLDKEGKPIQGPGGQDVDVKVALWFLQKAGIKQAEKTRGIAQGTTEPGAIHTDTGKRLGVVIDRKGKKAFELFREGTIPDIYIDNHPRERAYKTSSAKIWLELLKAAGFFKELDPKERRVMEMMARYSVNADNADFPPSKGGVADFDNSYRTLRGLGRYMEADKLFGFFKEHGRKGGFTKGYEAALNYEFKHKGEPVGEKQEPYKRDDFERYGLNKYIFGQEETPEQAERCSINQAREWFNGKSRKELEESGEIQKFIEEGRIIDSTFGPVVVNIVRAKKDRLLAGHEAVQAYGFPGFLSYDVRRQRLLLNTFASDYDLSHIPQVAALSEKQGTIIRGNMFIKPGDGTPLKISFRELLDSVKAKWYEPKGLVKEALELEAQGKLISIQEEQEQARIEKEVARKERAKRAAKVPKIEARAEPEKPEVAKPEKSEDEKLYEEVATEWDLRAKDIFRKRGVPEEKIDEYMSQSVIQDMRKMEIEAIIKQIKAEENG